MRLLTARDRVSTYQWRSFTVQHHHCGTCGCGTYSESPDWTGGKPDFDKDEGNRPATTVEILSKLRPAFRPEGTITAGNAPGLNDAAAAMVIAGEDWAEKRGMTPAARLVSYGIAAVEPGMALVDQRFAVA